MWTLKDLFRVKNYVDLDLEFTFIDKNDGKEYTHVFDYGINGDNIEVKLENCELTQEELNDIMSHYVHIMNIAWTATNRKESE